MVVTMSIVTLIQYVNVGYKWGKERVLQRVKVFILTVSPEAYFFSLLS